MSIDSTRSFEGWAMTRPSLEWEGAAVRVMADVLAERRRQLLKWGPQKHAPDHWMVILSEEIGELAEAILEGKDCFTLRVEAVQIAAVAAAIAQCCDTGAGA